MGAVTYQKPLPPSKGILSMSTDSILDSRIHALPQGSSDGLKHDEWYCGNCGLHIPTDCRCVYEPAFPKPQRNKKLPKPLKRSRVRTKSRQQSKRDYKYALAKKEYKSKHRFCECGCGQVGTVIHHKRSRVGSDLWNQELFMLVTNKCHQRIHANPKESYELGYLVRRVS